jgi:hypothetical protein
VAAERGNPPCRRGLRCATRLPWSTSDGPSGRSWASRWAAAGATLCPARPGRSRFAADRGYAAPAAPRRGHRSPARTASIAGTHRGVAMQYTPPTVQERRDITAPLGQGVVTSGGGGQRQSPTWRRTVAR